MILCMIVSVLDIRSKAFIRLTSESQRKPAPRQLPSLHRKIGLQLAFGLQPACISYKACVLKANDLSTAMQKAGVSTAHAKAEEND